MAVVTVSRIVWYDEVLWNEGHLVARWVNSISNKLTYHTRMQAPVNKRMVKTSGAPGDLQRSIRTTGQARVGPRARRFEISMAGHAVYVLKGTGPTIRAHSGRMWLPNNPGFNSLGRPWNSDKTRQGFQTVPGQDANDFLGRAWDIVSLDHSSIRGKLRDD